MLTRTPTLGPEQRVVDAFLDRPIRRVRPDMAVSVFCEPRLETGYPDVVVVHWHRRIAEAWPASRAALTTEDVRLLHFIHGARCLTRGELSSRSNARQCAGALDRLAAAQVVNVSSRWVRVRPLREIFAVRRIIALEAKISDWRQGLRQAFINTWFASESYLLLPRVPNGSKAVDAATQMGVGLVRADQDLSMPHVRPRRDRLPQSYASWLFNEWVGRGFGTLRA